MSEKIEQLRTIYPEGEGFELNGIKFFDPSYHKLGEVAASDQMVVEYTSESE